MNHLLIMTEMKKAVDRPLNGGVDAPMNNMDMKFHSVDMPLNGPTEMAPSKPIRSED